MCGIAGFYLTQNNNTVDGDKILRDMATCMASRGPDNESIVNFGNVGFAHRRLSIIDLESGNQPIYNESKSIAVIFNGEIYNYKELRTELEKVGHKFATNSDTEVLVHLYEEEGINFLERINGIAAIALYDKSQNKLILARDRFGVKPLYYTQDARGLFFASEVAALRKIPGIGTEPNWGALKNYFEQMYISQPASAWQGIYRLEAGHYIEISALGIYKVAYYEPKFKPDNALSRSDIEEGIIANLSQAVKRQLISDVPVGIFLSSGLDSLAVLAAAVEAGAKPHTFTLSFDESRYDEGAKAQKAAQAFGVPWTRVSLKATEFVPLLEERLNEVTEPFCAWVNVGKKLLAQSARAKGIPVCLSGAGGDEFFCGYPTLNAAVVADVLSILPDSIKNFLLQTSRKLSAGTGVLPKSFAIRSFCEALVEDNSRDRFFAFKRIFGPADFPIVFTPEGLSKFTQGDNPRSTRRSLSIEELQVLDMKNFLEGSILNWADHATMRRSIEEREPLLDSEFTQFALTIPRRYRFNLFRLKPIFRDALSKWLAGKVPADILSNSKRGFGLPLNDWLNREPLKSYIAMRLAPAKLKPLGVFNPNIGDILLKEQWSGRANNFRKIQALLGLVNHLERI